MTLGGPLGHVVTQRGQILVSRTDDDPFSRGSIQNVPRVYVQNVPVYAGTTDMLKHMCAWCRCTRRLLNVHTGTFCTDTRRFCQCVTPNTTPNTHHNTRNETQHTTTATTHGDREGRQRQRDRQEKMKDGREEKRREQNRREEKRRSREEWRRSREETRRSRDQEKIRF